MNRDEYDERLFSYLIRLTNGFDTVETTKKNIKKFTAEYHASEAIRAIECLEFKYFESSTCATVDVSNAIKAINKRLTGDKNE